MATFPFEQVQANIFKGHGRVHAWLLFFKFHSNCEAAIQAWLQHAVVPLVTSTEQQILEDTLGDKGDVVISLAFTATAYQKLKIPINEWPEDPGFRQGMKARGPMMKDPSPSKWDSGYQAEMDAMIMIADNDPEVLDALESQLQESIQAGAGQYIFTEKCKILKPNGYCIEHFGYADGISQPEFWNKQGRFHETEWKKALVRNLNSPHCYGSYLVIRKLEQNVKKFNEGVRKIAQQITAPNALELAEAQVMGRFKNGVPLTLIGGMRNNDFKYTKNTDTEGSKCPFHAHTRKINPRNKGYKAKQLTRRGMPYGYRNDDLSDEPEKDVGLLFMSYQVDIHHFEEIQIQCNSAENTNKHSTIDPIIGQRNTEDEIKPQAWNKKWHDPAKFQYSFPEVVQLKGGEYFFVPSMAYLSNLKSLPISS